MAEETKIAIGCVYPRKEIITHRIKGRNALTGLPQAVEVSCDEILEALIEPAMEIVHVVQEMLEKTSPELVSDIFTDGIVMTGGTSSLYGLGALIAKKTKMKVTIPENPENCVVLGAGKAIRFIDDMENKNYGVLNPLSAAY